MSDMEDANRLISVPSTSTQIFARPALNGKHPEEKLYYNMDKEGIAIVFDHNEFINETALNRSANEDDNVKRLEGCLNKLNFGVKIYRNLSAEEIEVVMTAVSKTDSSDFSCITIVVLSHGSENYLMAADRPYRVSVLWEQLIGKFPGIPKLFFIQARGGFSENERVANYYESNDKIPLSADFLRMFSFFQERNPSKSFRSAQGGVSQFIKTLCDVFEELAEEYELLQMLAIVTRMTFNCEADAIDAESRRRKSVPRIESSLTKFLKFKIKNKQEVD